MYKKLAINFLRYCTAPKKLLTSVAVVGLGNFSMTSTLRDLSLADHSLQCIPNIPGNFFQIHI
jgi:hypothetical protein